MSWNPLAAYTALAIFAALVAACASKGPADAAAAGGPSAAPASSVRLAAPNGSTDPGDPGSSAADEELAVGEAIVIDGTYASKPGVVGEAINIHGYGSKVVVMGKKPGVAQVSFVPAGGALTTRSFRVVESKCRAVPLNMPVVLAVKERARLKVDSVKSVEVTRHEPWIVGANKSDDAKTILLLGQNPGVATVMLFRDDGSIGLIDVFVGGACAERAYKSATVAIPPGMLGPKGDGTCVRREMSGDAGIAAECPSTTNLGARSDADFSYLACDWAGSCGRMGDEGCCVGCDDLMSVRLTRACATRIVRSNTCDAVSKAWDSPGCMR